MSKPTGHDYRPSIQRAMYNGLVREARSKGLTLSDYFAEKWAEDWKAAATIMAKFFPTNINVKGLIEHRHSPEQLSQTLKFLEAIDGGGESRTFEESSEVRPLLSLEVSAQEEGLGEPLVIPAVPGSTEQSK